MRAAVKMCELEKNSKLWEKDEKWDRNSIRKEESQKRSLEIGKTKDMGANGTFPPGPRV